MSMNPEEIINRVEFGTSRLEERIKAINRLKEAGYKVFFVLMMISGAIMTSSLAWDISDTFNGLMMLPNLIGVVVLCPMVMKITKSYVNRKIKNKAQEPMLSNFDDIQKEAAEAVLNGAE